MRKRLGSASAANVSITASNMPKQAYTCQGIYGDRCGPDAPWARPRVTFARCRHRSRARHFCGFWRSYVRADAATKAAARATRRVERPACRSRWATSPHFTGRRGASIATIIAPREEPMSKTSFDDLRCAKMSATMGTLAARCGDGRPPPPPAPTAARAMPRTSSTQSPRCQLLAKGAQSSDGALIETSPGPARTGGPIVSTPLRYSLVQPRGCRLRFTAAAEHP
jgi:hypothetical protein